MHPTVVTVDDAIGPGGAHHQYLISRVDEKGDAVVGAEGVFAAIQFQKGGRAEAGVNGCQNEDLIGIVIHRLAAFQAGPHPSEHNDIALAHLNAALKVMNARTAEREARGVEGKAVA